MGVIWESMILIQSHNGKNFMEYVRNTRKHLPIGYASINELLSPYGATFGLSDNYKNVVRFNDNKKYTLFLLKFS